ncbi:unnamed protein product [Phytophthora fragariaefolia]|uniref:Unnamed protein product n=1 Tax=Phytophthora fragariaefolia TaxID=1490495 RepID=A0A9W7D0Y9_9STRA|nr:unnamed protein product [Phytophthora fragariaefolia]
MAPGQYDTSNAAANGSSGPSTADYLSVELDIDSSGVPLTSATEASDFYIDLQSPPPQTQSMRLRLRKQASNSSLLSAKTAENLRRRVARVKKNKHPKEVRVFKQRLQLAVRIAVGVMLAGVVQTHGSDREWLFLPDSYYLGGLTVASMMVIYAAANTVGGVLEQVWQIDVGVAIALLYNFIVFACVPITQGDLMTVSKNINGSTYYVSLHDWGVTLPLLALFTLLVLLSPMVQLLTLVNPMNPIFTTILKDNSSGNSYYGTDNLLKQLAIYSAVGVVGTLIALATMVLPYPIFAMKKLRKHMAASPHDIRDILNLIVDSYCFRAKDIKKMDFFKLRLDRLLDNSHERLSTMESLLNGCWWEELVGLGVCFHFNKTVAKQLVKLYAKLLADLHAMKFAIEAETCHWSHVVLLKKMQTRFYVLQVEANDLLEDISLKIVHSSRSSSTAPTAIAMVAEDNIGGTYGNTVNRVGGLIAGTVVPSIFSFFVCKASSDYVYNTLNNIVLLIWTVGSMYVWFCGRYMALAGMTSAFMAASVLLDHSCRSTSSSAMVSYGSLTQNALGILILMIVEIVIHPRSSRGLLRSNVQQLLTQYCGVFHDVFRHHIANNRPRPTTVQPLTEEDIETANALLSRSDVKMLKDRLKVAIPQLLKTQAKLVNDSAMEPTLWKPPFSTSKYTKVLNVCRDVLDRLDVLVDLVEWHENRRSSARDKPLRRWDQSRIDAECTAAFVAAQEPPSPTSVAIAEMVGGDNTTERPSSPAPSSPLPNVTTTSPAVAKIKWDQSLAVVEAGVEEAFDTLVTLFGEGFSASAAEDHAIYLQMKEAFRIADVHRRGVVDASELALLLEKLMPYSGSQGIEGMEQYVDEFMQLVDKDGDGKISFSEFMQALNEGFRLELEIYDDQPQVPVSDVVSGPNGAHSKGVPLLRKITLRRNSIQSIQPDESDDPGTPGARKHITIVSPPPPDSRPRASSNFVDMSVFETAKSDSSAVDHMVTAQRTTSRRHRFRGLSSASESSAPEALLNVEAFTLTEAAAALKQSYGECLLGFVDDHSKRVTMEDFIVMSCVISACESIADNLTRLNTLAAS